MPAKRRKNFHHLPDTFKFDFVIAKKNYKLIFDVGKSTGHSMGKIINSLIEQKLADPGTRMRDQKRELMKKINEIDDQLKTIGESKHDKEDWVIK